MTDVVVSVLIAVFLLTIVGVAFAVAIHSRTPGTTLPERTDE